MRLAATVMLLRDAPRGIDVLMVRRSSASSFAPDAFVFPGGTVDPDDYDEQAAARLDDVAAQFRAVAPHVLPAPEPPVSHADAAALIHAAVRELREEASIDVDARSLVLFSHWITPPTEPRRYNTHFFIAPARAGATGTADAIETHDAQWIAPRDALARFERSEMHLVYPTIKHLERLAEFASVAEALAFTRAKPILTIMPDRAPSEGFVMPAELERAW